MAPRQTFAGRPDPVLKPGAIKAARYVRGISAVDAARRAGIGKTALVNAENGKTDLRRNHLIDIAVVLDMHPADLMREPYATAAREYLPDKGDWVTLAQHATREACTA
jgi:transcriptional regulator with XRE-family HTH domain